MASLQNHILIPYPNNFNRNLKQKFPLFSRDMMKSLNKINFRLRLIKGSHDIYGIIMRKKYLASATKKDFSEINV